MFTTSFFHSLFPYVLACVPFIPFKHTLPNNEKIFWLFVNELVSHWRQTLEPTAVSCRE